MIRNISIGVDIGSMMTKVIIGEFQKGEKNPKIIGVGESETLGMRHGYVTDISLVTESLKKAKDLGGSAADWKPVALVLSKPRRRSVAAPKPGMFS